MSAMATQTPSSSEGNLLSQHRSNEAGAGLSHPPPIYRPLRLALRPWHRRHVLQQMLHWSGRGLLAGLILACLLLLISRLIPWATAAYWALGVGATCFLCALSAAIWYRPSLMRTAHLVDAQLSLHDRVSTAWEMRNETTPLYGLQRRDALQQLGKHSPRTVVSLRPHRSGLITLSIVAIVLALLLLLPNPMIAVLQQQAAFQVRIAKQIAAIDQLRRALAHQTTTSAQQREQIDQILRDLEAQLHNANNETQAQQAIAEAQARLDQLRNPQANNQAQGHANASSSLQNSSNASLRAIGQALATNDSKQGQAALQSALQNFASQVKRMTPAQRAQLARQIEQAANQAYQNPQLRAALQQLARAIADGSPTEIADASKAVEAAASQDATVQAQSKSIDQASQSLQQAADNLASATDGTNRFPSPTDKSQSQNQNQGQGQSQNQGNGQGQGQKQGQGQGQ